MTRILVIEDDPGIADFVRRGLIFNDYEVDVDMTAKMASSLLATARRTCAPRPHDPQN